MFVKVIITTLLYRLYIYTLIVLGFSDGNQVLPVIFRQVNDYFSHIEDKVQRSSFDGRSRRGTGGITGMTVICGAIGTYPLVN